MGSLPAGPRRELGEKIHQRRLDMITGLIVLMREGPVTDGERPLLSAALRALDEIRDDVMDQARRMLVKGRPPEEKAFRAAAAAAREAAEPISDVRGSAVVHPAERADEIGRPEQTQVPSPTAHDAPGRSYDRVTNERTLKQREII